MPISKSRRARRPNPLSRSSRLLSGFDKTISLPGKTLLPVSLTAGLTTSTFPLFTNNSALGSRLNGLSKVFQEFKFSEIVLKIHPATNSVGTATPYMICYSKNNPASTPSTFEQGYQFAVSRIISSTETVPQTMTIPRSALLNQLRPWFSTNNTAEADDDTQGYIFVINPAVPAATTFSPIIELGYMVHLRGATSPEIE
jgi:hypothetical protein